MVPLPYFKKTHNFAYIFAKDLLISEYIWKK